MGQPLVKTSLGLGLNRPTLRSRILDQFRGWTEPFAP